MLLILMISTVFVSCAKQNGSAGVSAPVSKTIQSETGPLFTNADTGEKLYLGMSGSEVTRIFKQPNKDGWNTCYDNAVYILSTDGKVTFFNFLNASWKTAEGIAIGTAKSDVRALFGDPAETHQLDPTNNTTIEKYHFMYDQTAYQMEFMYHDDTTVSAITAFTGNSNADAIGTITYQQSGAGDMVLPDVRSSGSTLDITHRGDGNFTVRAYDDKGHEKLLVNTSGHYTGRLIGPDFYPCSLEITTNGEWTVSLSFKNSKMGNPDYLPLTGTGDDVTDTIGLNSEMCTWQIDYNGEGPFIVILHADGDKPETLVNARGKFSGTVSSNLFADGTLSETGSYMAYLEILCSGDWKIEQVKSF